MTEGPGNTSPKPPPVDRLSELWRRINDHKMVQWTVAYVAVAYAIQHGVTLTREALEWPQIVERGSLLLLALGLPVVMTFAWYHGERASRHFSKAELTIISLLLVVGSLVFYVFVQPSGETAAGTTQRAAAATAQSASLASGGTISLAVLPFVNLSSDKDQEFFSDGMTDEITSALAKVHDLSVVGRTSAFQFKGEKKDLRAIGQALSARYLIDGSVRKAGDRVRITAQLIEAGNGVQRWSENYDRELKDVFAVQEEIAQAIAGALKVPLGLQQGENLVSNRTNDLESYQQYLLARTQLRARGGGVEQAVAILEPVVMHDPGYAPAWALISEAYRLVPYYTSAMRSDSLEESLGTLKSAVEKAETAAQRAIRLDSKNAAGYAELATIEATRGQWVAAEDLYRKALALDPNDPDTLHNYSVYLAIEGRLKDALSIRERLRMLEPFVPVYNIFSASILQVNGQNPSSIALLETIPAGAAGGYYRNVFLAQAYAQTGRYKEAADTISSISGKQVTQKSVEDTARLLRQAPAKGVASNSLPSFNNEMNFVYAHAGALERVIEFPERTLGYAQNSTAYLLWLPEYAPLRKTERFKAYARKAGLVDYWRAKGWPDLCKPVGADDFACE